MKETFTVKLRQGGQHTERDDLVTWEGGPLEPDQPGETILFPVIQTCEGGHPPRDRVRGGSRKTA